jgi:hypothetical protein
MYLLLLITESSVVLHFSRVAVSDFSFALIEQMEAFYLLPEGRLERRYG